MSFADLTSLNTAIDSGQKSITQNGIAFTTANWAGGRTGSIWAASAPSTTGNTLTGPSASWPVAAPVTGHNLYLGQWIGMASLAGTVGLYDRLVETGGLSGTVSTAQTVNSAALPTRASGGAGVQLWIEWYTATGATQVTVTASYTNQSGTSGRTTPAINFQATPNTSGNGHEIQQLPLQAGDTGVQSVQSVTLSGTTGTAGNFGITLLKPLFWWYHQPQVPTNLDALAMGLPKLTSDMYLVLALHPNSSSGTGITVVPNFIQD